MSKFEDDVIRLLQQALGTVIIKREVAVKKLFPNYPSVRDRYDIVIPSLNIIVECHGAQHGELVSFGNEDLLDTLCKFESQKRRDSKKRREAERNGWSYVCIWHNELGSNKAKNLETLKRKLLESI